MTKATGRARLWMAAMVVGMSVLVTACGSTDEGSDSSPKTDVSSTATATPSQDLAVEPEPELVSPSASSQPSAPASPSEPAQMSSEAAATAAPPSVSSTDELVQQAAVGFVTVRENQQSHQHAKPRDWLTQVAEYMTTDGHSELAASIPEEGHTGDTWNVSHDEGLGVAVEMGECVVYEAAGVNEPDHKIVQCPVSDVVVGSDGKPVAVTEIPAVWPYVGPQTPAVLEMKQVGGKWLVHADWTGLAG